MPNNTESITKPINWTPLVVTCGLVLLLWGLNWFLPQVNNTAGTTGDMFGVVNSLFSAFAFVGIIFAILLQMRELEYQRQELIDTRKELKGQKEQLALQAETQKIQQFESTFFQMLSLHNERATQLKVNAGRTNEKTGQVCFETIYKQSLYTPLKKINAKNRIEEIDVHLNSSGYTTGAVMPYFRELYRIIEFIDNHDTVDQHFYTNLICDTMSVHEKLILFYFALSSFTQEGFQNYIHKYGLLRGLSISGLGDLSHEEFYHQNAYGRQDENE